MREYRPVSNYKSKVIEKIFISKNLKMKEQSVWKIENTKSDMVLIWYLIPAVTMRIVISIIVISNAEIENFWQWFRIVLLLFGWSAFLSYWLLRIIIIPIYHQMALNSRDKWNIDKAVKYFKIVIELSGLQQQQYSKMGRIEYLSYMWLILCYQYEYYSLLKSRIYEHRESRQRFQYSLHMLDKYMNNKLNAFRWEDLRDFYRGL